MQVTVRAIDRTGVEMEALTGAAAAALSLYDTAKAFDRAARIEGIRLLAKSGGASGDYRRHLAPPKRLSTGPPHPGENHMDVLLEHYMWCYGPGPA